MNDMKNIDKEEKEFIQIVGIGASAGGLDAFEKFFSNMSPQSDMAFVLVPHLDPTHKSILGELIKKCTEMNVNEISDEMNVEINQTYVIPPNYDLRLEGNRFKLIEPSAPRGLRLPIDNFFRSLAESQKENSIGIILSGTGTDGSLGLRAIKGVGGMIMVQSPETAKYNGMPQSAIKSNLVDFILAPEEMPERLISYVKHSYNVIKTKLELPGTETSILLNEIFKNLRLKKGLDFSAYKEAMILRRLEKRMSINNIGTLSEYVKFLINNNNELIVLYQELLIGVTNFFRDKEAFDQLKKFVIPKLFEGRSLKNPIRIWVPSCSTGEEAYSIAILITEYLNLIGEKFEVQIFATDVDRQAIEKARMGIYPDNIGVDVPEEYLKNYFISKNNTYEIKKEIRNSIVFAVQNVIADPPFSKLDLISCRNLSIYLIPEIQKKLLLLFHFALNLNGFLFLGNSESISNVSSYFLAINSRWKIFQKKETFIPYLENERTFPPLITNLKEHIVENMKFDEKRVKYDELVKDFILDHFSPSAVLINQDNKILYFHGNTGKFLEPSEGDANLDILEMAREDLHLELSTALRKAKLQKKEVTYQNIKLNLYGNIISINLTVRPISTSGKLNELILVIFEENPNEPGKKGVEIEIDATESEKIKLLEDELKSNKQTLQTAFEELEITNEELKSTNEELQSSNEEFQSTNEELQTSREELQSINEELITVNTELDAKINEISLINADLLNLIESTDVGLIFLDLNLNIKRFTPPITKVLNIIDSDIGRPFIHITSNLNYNYIINDALDVIKNQQPKNIDLETKDGIWYNVRILPYKTLNNIIDGVTISFLDITQMIKANQMIQEARDFSENIIKTIREPLLILDSNFRIISANRSFFETFLVSKEEVEGKIIFDLKGGQWDIPMLRTILEEILPKSLEFENYEVRHEFQIIGKKIMLLNARKLNSTNNTSELILLAFEDITSFRETEEKLKNSEIRYKNAFDLTNFYKDLFAHDMSNILQSIISTIEYYDRFQKKDEDQDYLVENLQNLIYKASSLIANVRKLSKIEDPNLTFSSIKISDVLKKVTKSIKDSFKLRDIDIEITGLTDDICIQGDELLVDIFDNILHNSVYYSDENKKLEIKIKISEVEEEGKGFIQMEIIDNGIGIPDENKSKLFTQHNNKDIHSRGMGMGLSLVKRIIDKYQGKIIVENRIKDKYKLGTNFKILLRKSV